MISPRREFSHDETHVASWWPLLVCRLREGLWRSLLRANYQVLNRICKAYSYGIALQRNLWATHPLNPQLRTKWVWLLDFFFDPPASTVVPSIQPNHRSHRSTPMNDLFENIYLVFFYRTSSTFCLQQPTALMSSASLRHGFWELGNKDWHDCSSYRGEKINFGIFVKRNQISLPGGGMLRFLRTAVATLTLDNTQNKNNRKGQKQSSCVDTIICVKLYCPIPKNSTFGLFECQAKYVV